MVNEVRKPHIPDLIDKVSYVNVSKCQTSHIQEQEVKSCKKAGRSHAKKPRGLKGRQANFQFESGQGRPDCGKFPIPSTHRFTCSMATQEKKIESKGKTHVHVQLSSPTSSSAHDDSYDSHDTPSIPSPIADSSLPFHFSASQTLKSDQKSIKSHRSDTSASVSGI